ncbi:MAG: cytochrome P450, partial [Aldersonia sp.]|nr:cytochrome P450 [Aldersonia sp.]
GVIARRRSMLALLEKLQGDRRAVERVRALRREFGSGPVELVIPGRRIIVVLDPQDVGRVLAEAPDPFNPANREKKGALQPFQPHGVLISEGPIRQQRRQFNEAVLDTRVDLHRLAVPFAEVIAEESQHIDAAAQESGHLDAATFTTTWWRIVRRLTLGEAARDDDAVTDELWKLRSAGNWTYFSPQRRKLRDRFTERLYRYVERADPSSLAGVLAAQPCAAAVDPVGQMPQWLFAFDAVGMASLRTLALLATHPEHSARARAEVDEVTVYPAQLPYLRSCVLESIRLWPTTPAILRDTTTDTEWGGDGGRFTIAAGAALIILAPAFHRDAERLPFADRFEPQIWLDGRAQAHPELVPFSAGPAECPGRNLVLFAASTLLANLLGAATFELASQPQLAPDEPLPMTLNSFGLDFAVTPVRHGAHAGDPAR